MLNNAAYFLAGGDGTVTRIYDVQGWCLLAAYESVGKWLHEHGRHTARVAGNSPTQITVSWPGEYGA